MSVIISSIHIYFIHYNILNTNFFFDFKYYFFKIKNQFQKLDFKN